MSCALYVGRVGALAVALGIGAVIAGVPGVAWAAPDGDPDPSDPPGVSASENPDDAAGEAPAQDPGDSDPGDPGDAGDSGDQGDGGEVVDSAGGMNVDSSGGAITSTNPGSVGAKSKHKDRDTDPPKKRSTVKPKVFSLAPPSAKTTPPSTTKTVAEPGRKPGLQAPTLRIAPPTDPGPQLKPSSPKVDVPRLPRTLAGSQPSITSTMTAVTKPLAQPAVSRLLSFVTLVPTADGKRPVSTDSPLLSAFLAGGRRASRQAVVSAADARVPAAQPQQSSLMMAVAAAVNPSPTVGVPNQGTGAVSGSLNGYTITSQPTNGTVIVTGDTYTYTPTVPVRLRAALTTQPDYDSFAVAISGQPASTVTVPILPAVLSNQSAIPAAGQPALATPTGIAINGAYAYVTNEATNANRVSVINIATGAVVKTISVGSQPSAVAISPTAKRAYVTNRASGTVTVVNTDTNTVVGSAIRVGTSPQDVAVNTAGTQVFVANNGSSSVSVIEPNLSNKVTTISLGFGNSAPTAIALSADGTRAYVTHRTITGGGAVSIINTSTKKVISTVAVGSTPPQMSLSREPKVYVANYNSSTVSVINTATNNSVTTLNVGSKPTSLAVSPDGSMVVIARDDDNIAIIDTKTTTVIGAQHVLDSTTPLGGHVVAFDSNGRVLITDAADHTVRVVGLARGNTTPVAADDPTMDTIDSNGVVTGALNITDSDGDSLTYTVSGLSATTGTVTVDSTGMYTFSPSQAARDQAAQPGFPTTVSFTVRAEDRFHAFKDATVTVPIEPSTPGRTCNWRDHSDHDADPPRRMARLPR